MLAPMREGGDPYPLNFRSFAGHTTSQRHSVWIPAFAGTTANDSLLHIVFPAVKPKLRGNSSSLSIPECRNSCASSRGHTVLRFPPWPLGRGEPHQRALQVVATPAGQDRRSRFVLHPFRHGLEAEPAGKI